ncbi:FtsX-like permease family protein [Microbacterium sp. NPDC056052]|uniref:FtsX-like permease family protein n=1 Tax=Microbacterium sp. NPDC056052 TaxID=3345695 RepID=UPI0035E086B1
MTRHPGTPAVVLRTALTTPLLSAFLVLAIAAMTLAGALVPPLIDAARTATVQHQIRDIPEIGRPLTAAQSWIAGLQRGGPGKTDVWSEPLAALQAQRDRQPEPLRSVLGTPRAVGDFRAIELQGDRKTPRNAVRLIMDPGLEQRSRLVQGAYPRVTDPAEGIEIVLSDQAAAELDWNVGEVRDRQGLPVTLTGLVAPSGADDLDWDMLVGSRAPTVQYTPMGDTILQTVGFMAPDEAGVLGDLLTQSATFAWIPLDVSRIPARDAATVSTQLRLFMANPVHVGSGGGFHDDGLQFSSPLADALDRGVARGSALVAVVSVAAVGPLTVAAVVLALAGRQLALRRRRAASLVRARGASLVQLCVVLGGETLVLGILGAAIGIAAGAALSSGGPDALTVFVAAVLVLVPTCAVPFTIVAGLRRAERRDGAAPRQRPWTRLVAEAVVVALAVGVAVVLRSRDGALRVDPVLLAMPVLIGAVGTAAVLRLLPLVLEALLRAARRRSGLISLLGPARALRDAALRTAPALAAVIGIAVAVFAVSFAATVSDGIDRTARDATGADIAASMPFFEDAQTAAARKIPGVEAVATLDADEIGQGASEGVTDRVRVYAVDRDAFARVQQGFDGALPLPASLTETSGGSIPVVASEQLLARFGEGLTVNGHAVRVVAHTAQRTPFGNTERWVIVDRGNIDRIGVASPLITKLFAAVAPGHDPRTVSKELAARLGETATVTTADQLIAQTTSDPASSALRVALMVAAAIVAVLLAVAVLQTLLLGAVARARLLALLRAVGYPRRRELPLVAWEVGPALVIALPVGVASGLAMSWLVIGALDLRGFTGGETAPALSLPPVWLAAAVLGFAAITAAAVLLATAAAMRLRSADAIRVSDDEG